MKYIHRSQVTPQSQQPHGSDRFPSTAFMGLQNTLGNSKFNSRRRLENVPNNTLQIKTVILKMISKVKYMTLFIQVFHHQLNEDICSPDVSSLNELGKQLQRKISRVLVLTSLPFGGVTSGEDDIVSKTVFFFSSLI